MRETVINEISKQKIIAIMRGLTKEEAVKTAKALYEGGITLVEVTFNSEAFITLFENNPILNLRMNSSLPC